MRGIYENYDDNCETHFIESSTSLDASHSMPSAKPISINIKKITEVKKFLRYLTPNGKRFFDSSLDNMDMINKNRTRESADKNVIAETKAKKTKRTKL